MPLGWSLPASCPHCEEPPPCRPDLGRLMLSPPERLSIAAYSSTYEDYRQLESARAREREREGERARLHRRRSKRVDAVRLAGQLPASSGSLNERLHSARDVIVAHQTATPTTTTALETGCRVLSLAKAQPSPPPPDSIVAAADTPVIGGMPSREPLSLIQRGHTKSRRNHDETDQRSQVHSRWPPPRLASTRLVQTRLQAGAASSFCLSSSMKNSTTQRTRSQALGLGVGVIVSAAKAKRFRLSQAGAACCCFRCCSS